MGGLAAFTVADCPGRAYMCWRAVSLFAVCVLAAVGQSGCSDALDALPVPVSADFEASPMDGAVPIAVRFTSASTGDITSWEWDFDSDGTIDSTEPNPSHIYTEMGPYTVTLTVRSRYDCNVRRKEDFILALEQDKTICVDGTSGDDENRGVSWSDSVRTIQRGIDVALGRGNEGWTVLVADGRYTGDGNRALRLGDIGVCLKSVGGPASCIIDCEGERDGIALIAGTVDGFTIENGCDSVGAGIQCAGSPSVVRNCVIRNCRTDYEDGKGGGVLCSAGDTIITNCMIEGNYAPWGSGVACEGASRLTIVGCVISGNEGNTGSVWVREVAAFLVNCRITGNEGDGVECMLGEVVLTNCTVADNAQIGLFLPYDVMCTLNNTIVWGNDPGSGCQIYVANYSTLTVNCCDYSNEPGDVQVLYNSEFSDPLSSCIYDNPVFYDPGAGDYRLQAGSPCIDAGGNSFVPVDVTTDLDGNPRKVNGVVDIGAYERQ
jgi:PKD repeat protein